MEIIASDLCWRTVQVINYFSVLCTFDNYEQESLVLHRGSMQNVTIAWLARASLRKLAYKVVAGTLESIYILHDMFFGE